MNGDVLRKIYMDYVNNAIKLYAENNGRLLSNIPLVVLGLIAIDIKDELYKLRIGDKEKY